MRTIWLVNGDNNSKYDLHRWWNIQAFNSKEDAERFIIEKNEEYYSDMARQNELNKRWGEGVITEEERYECLGIEDKWRHIVDFTDPKKEWYIDVIQFQE